MYTQEVHNKPILYATKNNELCANFEEMENKCSIYPDIYKFQ